MSDEAVANRFIDSGGISDGPARIGIVGTGWRAAFFLRVAGIDAAPIRVQRILAHSDTSALAASERWGVHAAASMEAFLRDRYDFVVVAVPRAHAPDITSTLVQRDIPVLLETPPAADLPTLRALYATLGPDAPVQVAEQYPYQPHHAARLTIARSGILGPITSASVSTAHDYHGIRLIRALLGRGFETCTITAQRFDEPVVRSLAFNGWAAEQETIHTERTTAQFRFDPGPDERIGLYDFEDEQYFSPIRSRHIQVRGERGELTDDTVRILPAPAAPVTLKLMRRQTGLDGDLEGAFPDRITLAQDVLWQNPIPGARLSDDEIAVATTCLKMGAFVRSGASFSPLADACHDTYLALLMHHAATTDAPTTTRTQPWMRQNSATQTLTTAARTSPDPN